MKVGDKSFIPAKVEFDYSKAIFEINSFSQFVDQIGINQYNGGENGDQNLGDFNSNFQFSAY